jgi:hypothetical protein
MYRKMQHAKLYNVHTATYLIAVLFVLKIDKVLRDQILGIANIGYIKFPFSENNYNKLYCVDCRAFHAAFCGIFCFSFDKAYQVMKQLNNKNEFVVYRKHDLFRMVAI